MKSQTTLKLFPPADLPQQEEKDEEFENLIQDFLKRTQADEKRKSIYSDILRELGTKLWYEQTPKLHNAKALGLAKECYMNALSICPNKNAEKELSILLQSKLISDKTVSFLNRTCKQQGAENFFLDAIRSYCEKISKIFPERKNEVFVLLTARKTGSKLGK